MNVKLQKYPSKLKRGGHWMRSSRRKQLCDSERVGDDGAVRKTGRIKRCRRNQPKQFSFFYLRGAVQLFKTEYDKCALYIFLTKGSHTSHVYALLRWPKTMRLCQTSHVYATCYEPEYREVQLK